MRTYKITDAQIIDAYVNKGLGAIAISKQYGLLAYSPIEKRIDRLVKRGLISSEYRASRTTIRKFSDSEAVALYAQGFGILKISKIFGCCDTGVARRLRKLGVLDSSRQFKRSLDLEDHGAPNSMSSRTPRSSNAL